MSFTPSLRCRLSRLASPNPLIAAFDPTCHPVPASSGVTLPPLECLFTVEEEIGLVGAFALDESMIKGRTMLNLASNDPRLLARYGTLSSVILPVVMLSNVEPSEQRCISFKSILDTDKRW